MAKILGAGTLAPQFTLPCTPDQSYDAQVLGISVDGVWCHRAFGHERRCQFPLLSDFELKGEVARKYGVYREGDGFSGRALLKTGENNG